MQIITGLTKATFSGQPKRKLRPKKHWFIYYVDENGRFGRKKINLWVALAYRAGIRLRLVKRLRDYVREAKKA